MYDMDNYVRKGGSYNTTLYQSRQANQQVLGSYWYTCAGLVSFTAHASDTRIWMQSDAEVKEAYEFVMKKFEQMCVLNPTHVL